jgi:pimeloyl-ACP methyl ester carboxylesterase
MKIVAILGWVLLALIAALGAFSVAYTLWANATWPPAGRFVTAPGARVHVLDSGSPSVPAPTVLLVHGASVNARDLYESLGPGLRQRYRVLAMDRPGIGHSNRPPQAEQLAVQAALAASVIAESGAESAIVVAQSLGAATALRLALDFPDRVDGLVLLAPASHPYPGGNAWHAELGATPILGPAFAWLFVPVVGPPLGQAGVPAGFAPAEPPQDYAQRVGLGLLFRPSQFVANAQDVVATNREFAAQSPRYPSIAAPTIIITPDRDNVVSPTIHAQALAAAIPAAELITLPGAGHAPQWSRPEACLAAVDRIAAMAAAPRER